MYFYHNYEGREGVKEGRKEGRREKKEKRKENRNKEPPRWRNYYFLTLNSSDARYPNPLSKEEHQQSGKVLKLWRWADWIQVLTIRMTSLWSLLL